VSTFVGRILLIGTMTLWPAIGRPAGQGGPDAALEKGTRIILHLNDHLSTKLSKEGDVFTADVLAPVVLRDRVLIPKGSVVAGSVSRIQRPGRFRGKAVMNLLFETVRVPGREPVTIVASLIRVDPEGNAGTGTEGSIRGERSLGKDAGTVAKPGAAGAGIGALIGGGKGAAIGAGIGAAAGLATVFATRGRDLEVKRGSTLEIVLDRPLPLTP
jgi:hypothetical protein